jgi:hypothetical protein
LRTSCCICWMPLHFIVQRFMCSEFTFAVLLVKSWYSFFHFSCWCIYYFLAEAPILSDFSYSYCPYLINGSSIQYANTFDLYICGYIIMCLTCFSGFITINRWIHLRGYQGLEIVSLRDFVVLHGSRCVISH